MPKAMYQGNDLKILNFVTKLLPLFTINTLLKCILLTESISESSNYKPPNFEFRKTLIYLIIDQIVYI